MDWDKALENEIDVESDTEEPTDIAPANDVSVPDTARDGLDTIDQANIEDPFKDESSVFVKPSLDLAGGLFGRRAPHSLDAGPNTSASPSLFGNLFNRPTDTPQLRPIPSPGLPIPSPIVSDQTNHLEYFAPFHTVPPVNDIHHALTSPSNITVQDLDSLVQGAPEPALHGMPQALEHPEAILDGAALSHPPPPLDNLQVSDSMLADSVIVSQDGQMPTVNLDQFHSYTAANGSHFIETEPGLGIVKELQMVVSTEQADDQPLKEAEDDYDAHVTSTIERDQGVEGSEGRSPTSVLLDTQSEEAESDENVLEEIAFQDQDQALSEIADEYAGTQSGRDSRSQSDVENEALYDEDGEAEYYSEDEFYQENQDMEPGYEDEMDTDQSEDEEDYEAPGRPPAQPEVIVLDSDSEDELASEQQTAPSPHLVRQRSVSSEDSQSSVGDDREDWSVIEGHSDHHMLEDQGSDDYESEVEDHYEHRHPDQDDRLHDSDMEDDEASSEDISAQSDYSHERYVRHESVEEEPDGEEHSQQMAEDNEAVELEGNLDSFSNVAVHEDQPDQANETPLLTEETSPHDLVEEQGQSTLDDEERTSSRKLGALITLDGAHDRPSFSKQVEDYQSPIAEETPFEKEVPLEEDTHGIVEETHSPEPQEEVEEVLQSDETYARHNKDVSFEGSAFDPSDQQLPTPDPTQEALSGYKSGPENEQSKELVVTDEQTPPVGLNISVSEESVPLEQQQDVDGVGVVLPTTELVEDHQQDHERGIAAPELTGKGPQTPMVVISKPPVPDRDAHGLRSKLSYFAPLATLADHYNALVDTISIVYEFSPVAKGTSGSRDYFITIFLTDPSMAGATLEAQIFRRYKSAMPSVVEGQAILLRDFKVQTHNHSMILVSVDSSSWAVFDGSGPDAKMTGPPVEYGSEERAFASGLRRWYSEAGAGMVADSQLQASIKRDSRSMTPGSVAASDAGSLDGASSTRGSPSARGSRRSRRSHRRVTIHELRDGTRYTEVGSPSGQHGIHELRDGTVYANE
jgi:hypothetical protein